MRNKQERTKEFKQQAGTGIWHCDMPKDAQKQQHKKVARNKRNRNWQGSRRNDVEAVNQVLGAKQGGDQAEVPGSSQASQAG
jgi:hypothetical protein